MPLVFQIGLKGVDENLLPTVSNTLFTGTGNWEYLDVLFFNGDNFHRRFRRPRFTKIRNLLPFSYRLHSGRKPVFVGRIYVPNLLVSLSKATQTFVFIMRIDSGEIAKLRVDRTRLLEVRLFGGIGKGPKEI